MRIFKQQETRSVSNEITLSTITNLMTGTSYTSAKAIENADVFTAVQMIASDIASLPLQKHVHGVLEHHDELATLFNVKSNQYYNAYQLKFIMVANALLNGESFIEIVRDNKGRPIELFHIKNSQISYRQDQSTNYKLVYDIATSKGKARRVQADNILHFRFFSLDGIKGISPINALRDDIDTQKHTKKFLSNFFKNGTNNGGILTYKGGKLSKEARDKLKDEWQKANAGNDEAHKVVVLDESMQYESIEINKETLELINTSNHSTVQVAKAFKIPRHKFGLETSNMSLEQMNIDYLVSTLQPYLSAITSEINFKLVDDYKIDIVSYKFNTDNYKTIDSETKVKNVRSQLEMGVINLDEARQEFGKEALADGLGQKHLVSLNYTTLDMLEDYQISKVNNYPVPNADDTLKGGENDE